MSGVSVVLQRVLRDMEGCVELLPAEDNDRGRLIQQCQAAMRSLDLEMQRSDMYYQDICQALPCACLALDNLVALAFSPEASPAHARMGALRERIIDSGVVPDLMTSLAEVWGITDAEDLPALSMVRQRTARMVPAWGMAYSSPPARLP
jgi:hypothetical protein